MKTKNLLAFLVTLFFITSPFFIIPRIIRIGSISCSSQYGPCNFSLEERLQGALGRSLFDSKREVFGILMAEAGIEDYSVQFKLPNTLSIELIERKPYFGLLKEDSNVVALVDNSGVVVSFQEDVSLPKLISDSVPPSVGEKVGEGTLFAAKLLLDMHTYYQIKEGVLANDGLVVVLTTGERVIFPLMGDRQILVASLTAILSRLKQGSDATRINVVKEIDLRFTNPVLR